MAYEVHLGTNPIQSVPDEIHFGPCWILFVIDPIHFGPFKNRNKAFEVSNTPHPPSKTPLPLSKEVFETSKRIFETSNPPHLFGKEPFIPQMECLMTGMDHLIHETLLLKPQMDPEKHRLYL